MLSAALGYVVWGFGLAGLFGFVLYVKPRLDRRERAAEDAKDAPSRPNPRSAPIMAVLDPGERRVVEDVAQDRFASLLDHIAARPRDDREFLLTIAAAFFDR